MPQKTESFRTRKSLLTYLQENLLARLQRKEQEGARYCLRYRNLTRDGTGNAEGGAAEIAADLVGLVTSTDAADAASFTVDSAHICLTVMVAGQQSTVVMVHHALPDGK